LRSSIKKRRFFDLYRNEFVTYTYSHSKRVYYIFYFFLSLLFRCPARVMYIAWYYLYIIYISYIEGSVKGGGRLPTHTGVAGVVDVRKTTIHGRGAVPTVGSCQVGTDAPRLPRIELCRLICANNPIYTPARPSPWLRRARGCGGGRLSGFWCTHIVYIYVPHPYVPLVGTKRRCSPVAV